MSEDMGSDNMEPPEQTDWQTHKDTSYLNGL